MEETWRKRLNRLKSRWRLKGDWQGWVVIADMLMEYGETEKEVEEGRLWARRHSLAKQIVPWLEFSFEALDDPRLIPPTQYVPVNDHVFFFSPYWYDESLVRRLETFEIPKDCKAVRLGVSWSRSTSRKEGIYSPERLEYNLPLLIPELCVLGTTADEDVNYGMSVFYDRVIAYEDEIDGRSNGPGEVGDGGVGTGE